PTLRECSTTPCSGWHERGGNGHGMTTLAHRPDLTELLDAPAPDRPTLAGNLRDIRLVNRALGFAAAVVREVAAVTARIGRADWTLLDVATGSADIPLAIVRWARRRGRRPRVLAGDLSPAVLAAARGHAGRAPEFGRRPFAGPLAPSPNRALASAPSSPRLHPLAPAARLGRLPD